MPVQNKDIADKFRELADLLEIKGANKFRVRAYRDAARTVGNLSKSVEKMINDDEDLSELSGIGEDLAGKIKKLVTDGGLPVLEDIKKEIPEELSRLMNVEGLGPNKVKELYDKLDIKSLDDLKEAVDKGKVREIEGFGEKTEENIREEIERMEDSEERIKLSDAEQYADSLRDYLENIDGIKKFDIAGSFRRRKETVGDLDICASVKRDSNVIEKFLDYEDIKKTVSKGNKKATVILKSGLQVDLRVVPHVSYGAGLMYFTGSRSHTLELRQRAVDNDWKLNEYGLFDGDDRIAGKTEKSVYDKFGLKWPAPELRENRGEFDAAENDDLPELIEQDDIRGDMHTHTKATDGRNAKEKMMKQCIELGYEYYAVTDHSKSTRVAGGLNKEELENHAENIRDMNDQNDKIEVLAGVEVDILEDGKLDLPDSILKELDYVVASIHKKFDLTKKKQTNRILKAMENEYVNAIGHPLGRKINEREAYGIDLEKIFNEAEKTNIHMELNSYPNRLDLSDIHCKMAKEMGVKIVIATDAHSTEDLKFMKYGIGQARRGWLEKDDVINTRNLKNLKKLLKRK